VTACAGLDRAVSDPIGLITQLVAAVEDQLKPEQIRAVVTAVAGGRAKSRRLALALANRPEVLADGRSPAPRAVGELLIALRQAGAATVSPPCCADCGKRLRTFQRRGQDWYCAVCGPRPEPCSACGNTRIVASRDRTGRPRCQSCPDVDGRDPITVIHSLIAGLDSDADPEMIASAIRRSAPRRSYQQKLAWALEERPSLLTGDGHLAPLRAIPRLIDLLHAAGIAGIVRPSCPGCDRVVRIDKPLHGMRVCRTVPPTRHSASGRPPGLCHPPRRTRQDPGASSAPHSEPGYAAPDSLPNLSHRHRPAQSTSNVACPPTASSWSPDNESASAAPTPARPSPSSSKTPSCASYTKARNSACTPAQPATPSPDSGPSYPANARPNRLSHLLITISPTCLETTHNPTDLGKFKSADRR
jgi:hypothetical protein